MFKLNQSLTNPYENIGVNLDPITNFDTQQPFINLFYNSGQWATLDQNSQDTGEYDKLNLDSNGWVKSLPPAEDPVNYVYVKTAINLTVDDYKPGQYVVLYQGQGTIVYRGDAVKNTAASTPGRDVINVQPKGDGIEIRITATDPNKTGNYIRNIRVVHKDYENTYQSQIFNPDFINRINDFKAFRFMDWMETKDSVQSEWMNRPKVNSYSYPLYGTPVEMMVNLANKTGADPWFCMPHMATNQYVTKFAQYVKQNLNPGLKAYVEYSNESWNVNQKQYQYMVSKGKQLWPDKPAAIASTDWYSKRTTEITRIWDNVFAAQKDRVIGVMGGFAANINVVKQQLKYAWATNTPTHKSMGIDAIAIAPYFGYYLGLEKNQSQIQSWIDQGLGLDNLFDEITKGGKLVGGPVGGALQQSYDFMTKHQQVASENGLQLLAYEGGQTLTAVKTVLNIPSITNLFTQANRDPRMYDVYKQYLTKWFDIGGGTFLNFNDIGRYSPTGNWGLLETVNQTSSPKYDAVMDLIHGV